MSGLTHFIVDVDREELIHLGGSTRFVTLSYDAFMAGGRNEVLKLGKQIGLPVHVSKGGEDESPTYVELRPVQEYTMNDADAQVGESVRYILHDRETDLFIHVREIDRFSFVENRTDEKTGAPISTIVSLSPEKARFHRFDPNKVEVSYQPYDSECNFPVSTDMRFVLNRDGLDERTEKDQRAYINFYGSRFFGSEVLKRPKLNRVIYAPGEDQFHLLEDDDLFGQAPLGVGKPLIRSILKQRGVPLVMAREIEENRRYVVYCYNKRTGRLLRVPSDTLYYETYNDLNGQMGRNILADIEIHGKPLFFSETRKERAVEVEVEEMPAPMGIPTVYLCCLTSRAGGVMVVQVCQDRAMAEEWLGDILERIEDTNGDPYGFAHITTMALVR